MRISSRACLTLVGVVVVATVGLTGRSAAQTTDGGTWGTALAVDVASAAPAGAHISSFGLDAVSCPSAGNCAAIGNYADNGTYYPFVVSEDDGTWGAPTTVSGADSTSAAGSIHISCAAPGDCAAIWSAGPDTYVIDESDGVWGAAQQVTMGTTETELMGISCPAAGTLLCGVTLSDGKAECSVPNSLNAGRYAITTSYDGDVNFTASTSAASYLTVAKASSATTLTLAKATITRGHENSEKLTVKVTSPATGYPAGKVTVKAGSGTVCVVTLKNGTGSCTLTASQLKAGSYKLTAGYAGDTNHASSGSSAKSLKVES